MLVPPLMAVTRNTGVFFLKITRGKLLLEKLLFANKINSKLTSITIKTCKQQP